VTQDSISSALGGLPVTVTVSRASNTVSVGAGSGSANIYLVTYTNSKKVNIQRGENSGKEITYRHPVASLRSIGKWNGKAISLDLPKSGDNCAVILQRGDAGAILGAAMCG
jgi:hypothetical protein